MLAEEDLDPRPQRAGEEHQQQHLQRREHEDDLQRRAPGVPEEADVVAGGGHQQQVARRSQDGGGVKDRLTRDEDVHRPARIARGRDGEKGHDQGVDKAARRPDVLVDAPEKQRIRIQVEVADEHRAQPEAHEIDRAALLRPDVPVELLDKHHADHRQHEPAQQLPCRGRRLALERRRDEEREAEGADPHRGDAQGAHGPARVAEQHQQEGKPQGRAQHLQRGGRSSSGRRARGRIGQRCRPCRRDEGGRGEQHARDAPAPARRQQQEKNHEPGGGGRVAHRRERQAHGGA